MIIKSLQMALSSLIPLAVVFCAQIGVRITYGDDAALALGTAGNILGIVVSLSVGCFVLSLRNSVESLKRVGRDDAPRVRESLSEEMSYGYLISAVLTMGAFLAAFAMMRTDSVDGDLFEPYILAALPLVAITPLNQTVNGFLMSRGQELKILTASALSLMLQLIVLAVVLLRVSDEIYALTLISAGSSAVTVIVFLYRLRLLSRLTLGGVATVFTFTPPRKSDLHRGILERVIAGLDGIIYMTVFLVATSVAARSSVADGASVAGLVAFMRLLIIPMKQFGVVGGRMMLSTGEDSDSFRRCYRKILPISGAAGLLAAGYALWNAPAPGQALPLAILVLVQVILEPFAGVTYSLLQVLHGPRSVITILVTSYVLFGLSLLLTLGLTVGLTAVGTWAVLLGVRLIFIGWVQRRARQLTADSR